MDIRKDVKSQEGPLYIMELKGSREDYSSAHFDVMPTASPTNLLTPSKGEIINFSVEFLSSRYSRAESI